jgi:site-specific DNA-methyltransferase (adenine-specific)
MPPSADSSSLDALNADPQNARTHGDRNLQMIVDALSDVGAARSIVVDEHGTVLAGNATVAAAARAGLSKVRFVDADGTEIIAVRRTGLTEEQKQRLALYDNRAAELAEWDTDVLASIGESIDLSDLWTDIELADLLDLNVEVDLPGDPDAIPDLPDDPTTQPGDMWHLGPHRLVCGDSTDPAILARLMDGERAQCLWTDPPYGVEYVGKDGQAMTIANDTKAGLEVLLRGAFTACNDVLADGAAFYIAHPAGPLSQTFAHVVTDLGWSIRQTLVWVKNQFVLGRSDYHYRHEPILFGHVPGKGRRGRGSTGWFGDNAQDSVFEVDRPEASHDHPTTKPTALVAAMIRNSAPRNGLVLDPFGGSGTTLLACEVEGRVARLVELDPRYCDVIVRRWEDATGGSAERQGSVLP